MPSDSPLPCAASDSRSTAQPVAELLTELLERIASDPEAGPWADDARELLAGDQADSPALEVRPSATPAAPPLHRDRRDGSHAKRATPADHSGGRFSYALRVQE
jgi:hypothetical protein